jgi:hypothetical protein
VLAEKAFVYAGQEQDYVSYLLAMDNKDLTDMVTTLTIQRMFRNPTLAPAINALYSSHVSGADEQMDIVDGQPVIDRYVYLSLAPATGWTMRQF